MSSPSADDPADIPMWRRLDRRLTTSGQPNEAQLAAIAALGVTNVINLGLHTHEQALGNEAASVRALGMTYVHLPVDFAQPTQIDFERFRAIMDELAGTTVHVHCIANLRVSAFLYRYRRERGTLEVDARAEMERLWRPGGAWAAFVGNEADRDQSHRYAGRDY